MMVSCILLALLASVVCIFVEWKRGNLAWCVSWFVMWVILPARLMMGIEHFRAIGAEREYAILSNTIIFGFVWGMMSRIWFILRFRKEGCFVRSAPFAIFAHPMCYCAILSGLPVWRIGDPFLIFLGLIFYVATFATIFYEEKMMIKKWGGIAEEYYRRTVSLHWFVVWWRSEEIVPHNRASRRRRVRKK